MFSDLLGSHFNFLAHFTAVVMIIKIYKLMHTILLLTGIGIKSEGDVIIKIIMLSWWNDE